MLLVDIDLFGFRMLGSLTFYRRLLHENVFSTANTPHGAQASSHKSDNLKKVADTSLPTLGHAFAGVMAGATVSFIAAPVEHIKARLQVWPWLYLGESACPRRLILTDTVCSRQKPKAIQRSHR